MKVSNAWLPILGTYLLCHLYQINASRAKAKAALIHFYSSARGISRTELYRRGKIIRLRYIFKSGRRVNVLLKVHHCWIVNSLYRLVVMNCLILHAATTVARSGHRQKPSIIQTKSNLLLYSTARCIQTWTLSSLHATGRKNGDRGRPGLKNSHFTFWSYNYFRIWLFLLCNY